PDYVDWIGPIDPIDPIDYAAAVAATSGSGLVGSSKAASPVATMGSGSAGAAPTSTCDASGTSPCRRRTSVVVLMVSWKPSGPTSMLLVPCRGSGMRARKQ